MYSSTTVDLTNCDREPIHVPGSLQAHGFLLVFTPDGAEDLVIKRTSANASEFLKMGLDAVLGARCSALFGPELTAQLFAEFKAQRSSLLSHFLRRIKVASGCEMDIITHPSGGEIVVEFERVDHQADPDLLNTTIVNVMAQLENLKEIQELGRAFTREVRSLTKFDRVLLYSFDEAGNGTVIAEDRNERLPTMLDLRFPAADIPQQARRLYLLNRVRIIPDVDYVPSQVVSAEGESESFDMTYSVLRSVSPVHREYMRNMGTAASMSISLVIDGRLWGMVSCHNAGPRMVPYAVRSGCDLLTRIVAAQISGHIRAADFAEAIRLKAIERDLLTYMAVEDKYLDGITNHSEKLLALTDSSGAALILNDTCLLMGETPDEPQVKALAAWLLERTRNDLFVSECISEEYPEAEAFSDVASGLLAVSLSQVHGFQILWFRPEILRTVRWAGDPQAFVKRPDAVLPISPRESFASWSELVRRRSSPWSEVELESARDFRNAVLMIVLRRAEELAEMAAELEFTNKELEAFSYSVSHDLRAPFRHISGFSELLLSDESDRLSERGKGYVSKISRAAQFAGQLVDSLLNFSQIARTKLEMHPIPMDTLFKDVWSDVVSEELNGRDVAFSLGEMPGVQGDVPLLRQALRNLLSNAAKYTRTREHARVDVSCKRQHHEYIFCVHDNGVGFDGRYAHKLFGAFQRLHRVEDFEGTGIGLANVRRIVARHGGQTWAEGKVNEGATFFFSLPVPETFQPESN